MHRRRAQLSSLLVAFLLVAAACGNDDPETGVTTTDPPPTTTTATAGTTGSTATTTGSTAEPSSTTMAPLTASFRGVTEDTIELGIAAVDFSQLLDLGYIDFDHGDEVAIWDALIAKVNDDGGIHGRRLTAIHDSYLPVGSVEAEASCLYFTEDNTVFAVLGLWIGDSVLCLTEAHQTIHVGHLMRQEWIDRSIATLASPDMAEERELEVLLDVLLATGRLDGRTIGVLTTTAAESSVDSVIVPFVEANDVGFGTVGVITDTQGDTVAVDREVLRMTEKWKVDGVDFLLVVGPGGVGSIPNVRSVMGDIDVAVIDAGAFQQQVGSAPEDERDRFDGVLSVAGLSPTNNEQFDEPLMHECVDTVEAAIPGLTVVPSGEVVGSEDWFAGIRDACGSLAVFVAAATAAGPNLTNDTFRAGLESLGSIDLPGQAFSSFGPGKYDGEDGFRLISFDPHDGEEGSFTPLTDIVDTAAE